MNEERLTVHTSALTRECAENDTVLLKVTVKYPRFVDDRFCFLQKLNRYYATKAMWRMRDIQSRLIAQARCTYAEALKNDFPFHAFEAVQAFTVTYTEDCALSLFTDCYEYTGGAHGTTIRSSDTWDLERGTRLPITGVIPRFARCKEEILWQINEQIAKQIETEEGNYFENYAQLTACTLNPCQFFLTNQGVVFYYQQYDIAPYASGIPEFTIGVDNAFVCWPRCECRGF